MILAVVAQMADRIKVLLRGDEVEEAETRAMLSAPREDYTKSYGPCGRFKDPQNRRFQPEQRRLCL